jgi:dimethylargininase
MAWRALTREISPAIDRCELTHRAREPIDLARARRQHRAYEAALTALGCTVTRLPADDDMPDSVFIEDTAVVLPEVAIVTRPGAESRRGETLAVAEALAPFRRLVHVDAPATLDGGDVLVAGRRVIVGEGGRSNAAGVGALRDTLEPLGYFVTGVPIRGCLHLKSAVTCLDETTVLMNPDWVDAHHFEGMVVVEVDASEPFAANVLRVGPGRLASAEFPRTCARVQALGYQVMVVENTELAKAEGAMTCGSLLFEELS